MGSQANNHDNTNMDMDASFVLGLKEIRSSENNIVNENSGIEIKFRNVEADVDLDLDTNDIRFSIPRFKEEVNMDFKIHGISHLVEETHYKARHETEVFHHSCWYKTKIDVTMKNKPRRFQSTCYLIPKDDTCISEVEFWMSGTKRRESTKEQYFHRKVSVDEARRYEQMIY